jgi:hypothetical protein
MRREQPLTFSAVFSADEATAKDIRTIFLATIRQIEERVGKTRADEDAFRLTWFSSR